MLDSIVTAILDDTKFQQALMDKAAPPVPLVQKYEKIRGVVLKNGETIVGDIISMNVESVQIRTTDGRVLSYSFTDEVQSLIKE
jgi:small-conductance mechanosensitive channel